MLARSLCWASTATILSRRRSGGAPSTTVAVSVSSPLIRSRPLASSSSHSSTVSASNFPCGSGPRMWAYTTLPSIENPAPNHFPHADGSGHLRTRRKKHASLGRPRTSNRAEAATALLHRGPRPVPRVLPRRRPDSRLALPCWSRSAPAREQENGHFLRYPNRGAAQAPGHQLGIVVLQERLMPRQTGHLQSAQPRRRTRSRSWRVGNEPSHERHWDLRGE